MLISLIALKFNNLRKRIPLGLLCIYLLILCHVILYGRKMDTWMPVRLISYLVVPWNYIFFCDVRLSRLSMDYIKPLTWFAAIFIIMYFVSFSFQAEFPTMINYPFILQIFLILMSIYILITRDIRVSGEVLQETSDYKGQRPSQRQTRTIEISRDFESAFDLCVNSMDNYQLMDCMGNKKKGILKVKAIDWGNGTDLVSFRLKRIDDHNTQVLIKSQPLSLTVDQDGRNYKRIEEIVKFLK